MGRKGRTFESCHPDHNIDTFLYYFYTNSNIEKRVTKSVLFNILLIGSVITCLVGMCYNLYRVITNDSRPEVLHSGIIGFVLFGMVFLTGGVFMVFYFSP